MKHMFLLRPNPIHDPTTITWLCSHGFSYPDLCDECIREYKEKKMNCYECGGHITAGDRSEEEFICKYCEEIFCSLVCYEIHKDRNPTSDESSDSD